MRPVHLHLEAFGSYAGALDVDFRRLSQHGTFAITGPTGAGKSTIFDAIVYALYGDLPGYREAHHIRSQYAEAGRKTTVTFELEVHGVAWTITRTPAQERPRKTGTGDPVWENPTAWLRPADATSGGLTKINEIKAEIIELVGLEATQFQQVVLIPQGRFEEVLKAKTTERSVLLKKLFPVDIYQRITERLEAASRERKVALDEAIQAKTLVDHGSEEAWNALRDALPDDLAAMLADDDEDPADALGTRLARVEPLVEQLNERVAAAEADATRATSAHRDAEERHHKWSQWRHDTETAASFPEEEQRDAELANELSRAEQLLAHRATLTGWQEATATARGANEALARQRERLTSAEDLALDAAGAATRAGDLERRANELEAGQAGFDALEQVRRQIEEDGEELERRKSSCAARQEQLGQLEQSVATGEQRCGELQAVVANYGVQVVQRDQVRQELVQAGLRDEMDDRISALAESVEQARRDKEAADSLETSTLKAWVEGAAGRLAEQLRDGEACPTCGSTDHPAPAQLSDRRIGDDELAATSRAADAAGEALGRLVKEMENVTGQRAMLADLEPTDEVRRRLDDLERIVTATEKTRQELDVATEQTKTLLAQLEADRPNVLEEAGKIVAEVATRAEREERWNVDRSKFVESFGAYASLHEELAATTDRARSVRELGNLLAEQAQAVRDLERMETLLGEVLLEFGMDSPGDLLAHVRGPGEIGRDRELLQQRRDNRAKIRMAIDAYTSGDGPVDPPDLEATGQAAQVAAVQRNDLLQRFGIVNGQLNRMKEARQQIADSLRRIDEARSHYSEAVTLYYLCAGRGAGPFTVKQSLENWVLADYLTQVLHQANAQLDIMTAGRYSLRVAEVEEGGQGQRGLDIEAFDVNTGQWRSAATLSGGETFMAALALALGLADVVSGGTNRDIGALFVDEGFGSLDHQSLDAVIEVLRQLEEGGRIVGVISHVDALKEALPSGITVETSTSGSRAHIHYPGT